MLLLLTTTATREDAQQLAHALVKRRLVACAQISQIESVYVWKGQIEQGSEWRLLLKTMPAQREALERAVKELHPYELPAIVWLDAQGSHEFEDWVNAQTISEPTS
jgi:periplasmic divalent cation tolerance protein